MMKRHWVLFLLFSGIISLSLCSCATMDLGAKKSSALDTSGKTDTFYVGVDGLKVFPEPRFSKTCIAELALHEKVVRDQLEKGFAHIRVVKTGQTGWVNNAHLLWKICPSAKTLPQTPEPLAAPPPPDPAPEKTPPQEEVIQEPECADPDREGRDAAIFNRF